MVETKLNDALIERIQNSSSDPSIVDMKLSNGFASLMVWSDFFKLTKGEREFLFYLVDQIEAFDKGLFELPEPVPRQAVDAPPADSTQSGAAPDPDPDGPIEDAVFPTTEQIRNQRHTNNWDVASHERTMYGPIERHPLPDPDVVEKIREVIREVDPGVQFTDEPPTDKLFPLPNDPPPARKKPGREYKKKDPPVPPIPQSLEVMHVCSRCEAGYENAALLRNHERKFHGQENLPCIHSWLLGAPIGPTVTGTCKFCSALKDFPSAQQAVPLSLDKGKRRNG